MFFINFNKHKNYSLLCLALAEILNQKLYFTDTGDLLKILREI